MLIDYNYNKEFTHLVLYDLQLGRNLVKDLAVDRGNLLGQVTVQTLGCL